MSPAELYSIHSQHPTGFARKVYESLLYTNPERITETEMYRIADTMTFEEGCRFIDYCRANNLLRERRMSDTWERNYIHSCARRYAKRDKPQFYNRNYYREVTHG